MTALLRYLLAIMVYTTAGGALFFIMYNRRLLPMRDRLLKRIVVPAAFAFLMMGSFTAGLLLGYSAWLWMPGGLLLLVAIGEVHRLFLRKRHRGAPPEEETTDRAPSLLRPLTTADLVTRRYELPLPQWTGPRIRIAHLTDIHANRSLPFSYYERVMSDTVSLKPDLVFITGDFVSHAKHLPLLEETLSLLEAKRGIYAVLGNHDHWTAADEIPGVLAGCGVTLLGNGYEQLRFGDAVLTIAGCETPWCDDEWKPPSAVPGNPLLMLSHTADNIGELSRAGANAAFCGHYHGGQVNLPGIGALACPSRFGRRFDHGHFIVNGTHLFVSAGIGCHFPPVRVYCPPEILIVDLLPAR